MFGCKGVPFNGFTIEIIHGVAKGSLLGLFLAFLSCHEKNWLINCQQE